MEHWPPTGPQLANETGVHVSPAQQPLAHEVASQPQTPDTQLCPGLHAGPAPH